jgi:hypothetical protein
METFIAVLLAILVRDAIHYAIKTWSFAKVKRLIGIA